MKQNSTPLTRFALAAIALTVSAGSVTPAAHAQEQQNAPKVRQRHVAIKLGRFARAKNGVTDVGVTNVRHRTWVYMGLSVDVTPVKPRRGLVGQLFLDLASDVSEQFDSPLFGSYHGGGLAGKYVLAPAASKTQPYVGLGVGCYNASVSVLPFTSTASLSSRTENRFGGKVFAGFQFSDGFCWEADYTIIKQVSGVQTGGLGVRLGYRF